MIRKFLKSSLITASAVVVLIFVAFVNNSRANGPTKYPIVLVHGWFGFSKILGVSYFYGVQNYLESQGYNVYVTQEDMFGTIQTRATELGSQIQNILNQTGAGKVNIIAHSMGALDARYLISSLGFGDRVATLTMIGGVNHGTSIADVALGLMPGSMQDALGIISWFAGCSVDQENYATCEQNAITSAAQLTIKYVQGTFNPQNPDDPRVKYFSYGGSTWPWYISPVVAIVMVPSWLIIYKNEGANDELVSVSSAKWGTYLGTLQTDHLGEIGQLLGLPAEGFQWLKFYGSIAQNLKNMGY
ncbi:MAG: esterase/lipase family protein [bacterium]